MEDNANNPVEGQPEVQGNEEGDAPFQWSLDNIPIEVFLHIFSFLDAEFASKTLGLVCKKFYEIVNDNVTWRIRMAKQWPDDVYPPLPVQNEEFDWKRACVERETQRHMWANRAANMDTFTLSGVHFSSVDTVHFMKNSRICFSGSRDRSIIAWNVDALDPSEPMTTANASKAVLHKLSKAHRGWVWSISSWETKMASASWDTSLKVWQVGQASVDTIAEHKCRVAVLCAHLQADLLAAGLYDKKVLMYDPRAEFRAIRWYREHQRPVLCMLVDGNKILTGSEDGSVAIWDRAAGKKFKSLQIPGSYPLSMHQIRNLLYVGDKSGRLHVIDTKEGKYELKQTQVLNNWARVTGVYCGLGSVITCATDGSLRILEPSQKHKPIAVLTSECEGLAGIDIHDGMVAAAATNGSVLIWKPKIEQG